MALIFALFTIFFTPVSSVQERGALIMFWNVENFFDTRRDFTILDEEFLPQGEKRWSRRRFEQKRDAIAKTIISIESKYGDYPDLVGLAEVENSYVLRQITEKSPLNPLGYNYIHSDSGYPRGIDVALIYRENRVKVLKSSFIKPILGGDTLRSRDILYAKLSLSRGDTINLFVVHLPSKYSGRQLSMEKRELCVKVLRHYSDSIIELGEKVVIVGDFNDLPSEIETLFSDDNCNYNNHFKEYQLFENGAKGSVKFMNSWQIIDQVITSRNCQGRAKIYAPKFLLEHDTKYLGVKPFRTYSGPRHIGGVSDHLPILFQLE